MSSGFRPLSLRSVQRLLAGAAYYSASEVQKTGRILSVYIWRRDLRGRLAVRSHQVAGLAWMDNGNLRPFRGRGCLRNDSLGVRCHVELNADRQTRRFDVSTFDVRRSKFPRQNPHRKVSRILRIPNPHHTHRTPRRQLRHCVQRVHATQWSDIQRQPNHR